MRKKMKITIEKLSTNIKKKKKWPDFRYSKFQVWRSLFCSFGRLFLTFGFSHSAIHLCKLSHSFHRHWVMYPIKWNERINRRAFFPPSFCALSPQLCCLSFRNEKLVNPLLPLTLHFLTRLLIQASFQASVYSLFDAFSMQTFFASSRMNN